MPECKNNINWCTYHTTEHLKAFERSDGSVLWCPCFPAIIGLDSSVVKCDCRSQSPCGQLTPLWSMTWWRDADAVLSLLSSTPLPLPHWAFTTCLASNNKSWLHPFYFCHDYSLTNQAGPGLPFERLDLTNIPHWMRKETKVCSVGTSDFAFGEWWTELSNMHDEPEKGSKGYVCLCKLIFHKFRIQSVQAEQ